MSNMSDSAYLMLQYKLSIWHMDRTNIFTVILSIEYMDRTSLLSHPQNAWTGLILFSFLWLYLGPKLFFCGCIKLLMRDIVIIFCYACYYLCHNIYSFIPPKEYMDRTYTFSFISSTECPTCLTQSMTLLMVRTTNLQALLLVGWQCTKSKSLLGNNDFTVMLFYAHCFSYNIHMIITRSWTKTHLPYLFIYM